MTALITFAMLFTPLLAQAARPPAAKTQPAQTQPAEKNSAYRAVAAELLKDCEGADKAIAVVGFSYSDGRDSRDGNVVAERITSELVKIKKVKVIERKEIDKVFAELKLQRSGAMSPDSARSIGKMLGADWVVLGTLTELPNKQLELNARLAGAESGEIINASVALLTKDWLDKYARTLDAQAARPNAAANATQPTADNSPKAKLEKITIPGFQRAIKQQWGSQVSVQIDFDSFAYDEDMLRLLGSEVLPAILSVFKGPDGAVFSKVSAIDIKLDNSFSQTVLVKKDANLNFTLTNKISNLAENVKFRMDKIIYEGKKAAK